MNRFLIINKTIIISYDARFKNMSIETRLRSIANELTNLLYGKNYTNGEYGVLGTKGHLLTNKNKLRDHKVIINLNKAYENLQPNQEPIKKKTYSRSSKERSFSRDADTIKKNIISMASHARSNGIDCLVQ